MPFPGQFHGKLEKVSVYLLEKEKYFWFNFIQSINYQKKKKFVFDEMSSRCCLWLNLKGLRTQNCARKWSISCKWTTLARFLSTKYIVYKLYIHLLYPQGVTCTSSFANYSLYLIIFVSPFARNSSSEFILLTHFLFGVCSKYYALRKVK